MNHHIGDITASTLGGRVDTGKASLTLARWRAGDYVTNRILKVEDMTGRVT